MWFPYFDPSLHHKAFHCLPPPEYLLTMYEKLQWENLAVEALRSNENILKNFLGSSLLECYSPLFWVSLSWNKSLVVVWRTSNTILEHFENGTSQDIVESEKQNTTLLSTLVCQPDDFVIHNF